MKLHVAVPVDRLLADPGFRARLVGHGVPTEAAPVGVGWYLQLAGRQTVASPRPTGRQPPTPSGAVHAAPEHGLVPFLGRQPLLHRFTRWCQDPATDRPFRLVIGAAGRARPGSDGRRACGAAAGWDAGLADDQRRDGTATTRLQRPTLLVVDDADIRTGLISGSSTTCGGMTPDRPVPLLCSRGPSEPGGTGWSASGLASSYTVLDLDSHPVPLAGRSDTPRASTRVHRLRRPRGAIGLPTAAAELDDPAYADPLVVHVATLLRTVDTSATRRHGWARTTPRKDVAAGTPGHRLGRRCCRRCASGSGPAGISLAGVMRRSTRPAPSRPGSRAGDAAAAADRPLPHLCSRRCQIRPVPGSGRSARRLGAPTSPARPPRIRSDQTSRRAAPDRHRAAPPRRHGRTRRRQRWEARLLDQLLAS